MQVYPEFFDIIKLYFESSPKTFSKVIQKAIIRIYPYKEKISWELINLIIEILEGDNLS